MDITAAPVFQSLLETDLYKFTMQQTMLHFMPNNEAEYRFACRNTPEFPLIDLVEEINEELDALCALKFTEDELAYLSSLRYLRSDYIDFLRLFQFQRRFITVTREADTLHIVAKGPQVHVMGFEIFVLAIVNELYFRRLASERGGSELFLVAARKRLHGRIEQLQSHAGSLTRRHPFEFFALGVRRRFSGAWQAEMVKTLAREVPQYFKGTSNVLLANESNLVPMGTMAHEYLQTFQATSLDLRSFQKAALDCWAQEYRGDLGTALTDVIGMDAFLLDFDLEFANQFDGLRHDSGDPVIWGEKALAHYAKLRINANNKRLVFTEGVDVATALDLHRHFADRVKVGFGMGTTLSNDTGLRPLNVIMKLVSCNGKPTAKLSDAPGKTLCNDANFLAQLRQMFHKPE